LQVCAARLLGLDGLGQFAALFAIMIMATALSSGFVGDSLTVLERSGRSVRAGLESWTVAVVGGAAVLSGGLTWAVGFLDGRGAVAFGAAVAAYMLEDIVRRLLMATLTFWRIVAVDMAAAIGTLGSLFALAGVVGAVSITHFLVAIAVGQLIGVGVGIVMVPRAERWLAGLQHAAWGRVFRYGSWRAVQQLVRPALLLAVRVVCLVGLGLAATGQLEAARIYVAPAMLVVGGVSAFLFASYAVRRETPLEDLIRTADRAVIGLVAAISLFGVVAVLALPILGPLLTGGQYDLQVPAVIGWVAFAASVAAVTPYGSLAAVRGRQVAVLAWRVADSAVSLLLVATVVVVDESAEWVPVALTIGSLLGGLTIRQVVLRGELRRQRGR
jgi:O-antigen/teichoic acid export membrane protein